MPRNNRIEKSNKKWKIRVREREVQKELKEEIVKRKTEKCKENEQRENRKQKKNGKYKRITK